MRLSEVLGATVIDADGRNVGTVHDAVLVADGDLVGAWGPSLRLHALVVGKGSLGARLGLHGPASGAPWLLRTVLARHEPVVVDWRDVTRWDGGRVELRRGATLRSRHEALGA